MKKNSKIHKTQYWCVVGILLYSFYTQERTSEHDHTRINWNMDGDLFNVQIDSWDYKIQNLGFSLIIEINKSLKKKYGPKSKSIGETLEYIINRDKWQKILNF